LVSFELVAVNGVTMLCYCALRQGILTEGEGSAVSTIDLLIKIACFVKEKNIVSVSARRTRR
jgi:hypothetical protein